MLWKHKLATDWSTVLNLIQHSLSVCVCSKPEKISEDAIKVVTECLQQNVNIHCYPLRPIHYPNTIAIKLIDFTESLQPFFPKKGGNVLSWSNCGITSYQTYPPLGPLKRVCCITLMKPTYFNPRSCIFDHFGPEKQQKPVQPVLRKTGFHQIQPP